MKTINETTIIRNHIEKDEIEIALNKLKNLLQNDYQLDEVILQAARNNRIENQVRNGVISFEKSELTKNQISKAILEILREIDNYKLSNGNTNNSFPQKKQNVFGQSIEQKGLMLFILSISIGIVFQFFNKNKSDINSNETKSTIPIIDNHKPDSPKTKDVASIINKKPTIENLKSEFYQNKDLMLEYFDMKDQYDKIHILNGIEIKNSSFDYVTASATSALACAARWR